MTPSVSAVAIDQSTVFARIGSTRNNGPVVWPPLEYVQSRGGGSGRFDDPRREESEFTVLYAAHRLRTCFLETLDVYRPDAHFISLTARIDPAVRQEVRRSSLEPFTEIPEAYFTKRIGRFRDANAPLFLDARLDAVETALSLSQMPEVAAFLGAIGYLRITLGDLVGGVRSLTRHIALWAFQQGYAGIVYNSTHQPKDAECLALFSHRGTQLTRVGSSEMIPRDDPDLIDVASQFKLSVPAR